MDSRSRFNRVPVDECVFLSSIAVAPSSPGAVQVRLSVAFGDSPVPSMLEGAVCEYLTMNFRFIRMHAGTEVGKIARYIRRYLRYLTYM